MNRKSYIVGALVSLSVLATSLASFAPVFAKSAVQHTHPQGEYILVGAAASPPMGKGDGRLLVYTPQTDASVSIPLASGSNAFRIAVWKDIAYVPTLQGVTYVVDLRTHRLLSRVTTTAHARIANVTADGKLLLITGPTSVTAYSLPDFKVVWSVEQGGNALAIGHQHAYLAGNTRKDTVVIDLKTGHVQGTIPVGRIEDAAYDRHGHTLWLADWYNGDMTVVNTTADKVEKVIHTTEGDPQLNPKNMMMTTAGFMQLAVGPDGSHVYAAGFSGHILVFSAVTDTWVKSIPVGTAGMGKLSGLAIDPSGLYAYTTVENKKETDMVSLRSGKVVHVLHGLSSNRWLIARQ